MALITELLLIAVVHSRNVHLLFADIVVAGIHLKQYNQRLQAFSSAVKEYQIEIFLF